MNERWLNRVIIRVPHLQGRKATRIAVDVRDRRIGVRCVTHIQYNIIKRGKTVVLMEWFERKT